MINKNMKAIYYKILKECNIVQKKSKKNYGKLILTRAEYYNKDGKNVTALMEFKFIYKNKVNKFKSKIKFCNQDNLLLKATFFLIYNIFEQIRHKTTCFYYADLMYNIMIMNKYNLPHYVILKNNLIFFYDKDKFQFYDKY